ncbi:MAG: hypothetical protein LBC68_12555 [Prevotellaceae bacterium]|jgi:FlaA1/EpsC-like NDP-sugar epimerase|nr:hypothetical protein [Prevotellaceae bacterium]
MKKSFLFPHRYKLTGWFVFIPFSILGLYSTLINEITPKWLKLTFFAIAGGGNGEDYFSLVETDMANTIIATFVIIGGLLVAFSREKIEDEYIAELRLSSLQWAVFINYLLLLLCFIFVYNIPFFIVMIYNMFTTLFIFIVRFNYLLLINRKSSRNEK